MYGGVRGRNFSRNEKSSSYSIMLSSTSVKKSQLHVDFLEKYDIIILDRK